MKVSGKNIYNFIYRLNKLGIELLKIDYTSIKEARIEIYKYDYDKVIENKTIYEVEIEAYDGMIKARKILLGYKYILTFIIISLLIIYFLSNLIFRIDIITNDETMKAKIQEYLKENGVSLYHVKKNYSDIQKIKEGILNKYKNEIDWIEIEAYGSKYIVRYEPRVKTEIAKDNKYQNIVASHNAIIYSMDVSNGQIIRNRFDYVKKGDVIVSGYIYLNDQIKNTVKAIGTVYGETWYKVKVNYPINYENKTKTGKSKNVVTITFLNNEIQLFNFDKYKNYDKQSKVLFKNNILPISINYQKQEEIKLEKENNSYKEAVNKAVEYAKEDLSKNFDENSYIKDYKILSEQQLDNFVSVELFVSVIEIISEYQEIDKFEDSQEPINE